MTQKNRKLIVVSKENYNSLRKMGTITDSFDSVITQLIKGASIKAKEEREREGSEGSNHRSRTTEPVTTIAPSEEYYDQG